MQFKINQISTLNQKMKTSKKISLSWQNKLISTALAAASLFLGTPQSYANVPSITSSNLTLVAGSMTATSPSTNSLTISAASTNTVLNWASFSDNTTNGGLLATGDTVTFTLPTGGAILNNITGANPSVLDGAIRSNGNVFFLNPNGIIVSSSAQINVGGFYASTIPDDNAISYFYQTGTLGVFNNVSQSKLNSAYTSGIIYVESGANITTSNPSSSGGVGLASAYNQGGVTINRAIGAAAIGSYLGAGGSASGLSSSSGTTQYLTLNQGIAAGDTIKGITVDSTAVNGNLTIISLGSGAGVNLGGGLNGSGNNVTSNSVSAIAGFTSSGALAGGSISISTNSGPVNLNGNENLGAGLTVNTVGLSTGVSNGAGSIYIPANITTGGNISLTANGVITAQSGSVISSSGTLLADTSSATTPQNITLSNSVIATGAVTLTTSNGNITNTGGSAILGLGTNSAFNAGTKGDITLNMVHSAAVTVSQITANSVAITDKSSGAALTVTNLNVPGNSGVNPAAAPVVSLSNYNNVTVTTATVNGGITLSSSKGSATLGSTSATAALSTFNGAVTVTGNTGATFATGNIYSGINNAGALAVGSLVISTSNGDATGAGITLGQIYNGAGTATGNISVVNVTVNGNITATASTQGSVSLTNVSEAKSNTIFSTINAWANAGTISMTGVTTNNGFITATSNAKYSVYSTSGGYAMSLVSVNNNTPTHNADPVLSGYSSALGDLFYTQNGTITVSGYNTTNGNVSLTAARGNVNSGTALGQDGQALSSITGNVAVNVTTNGTTLTNLNLLKSIGQGNPGISITTGSMTANAGVTVTNIGDLNLTLNIAPAGFTTSSDNTKQNALSLTSTTGNVFISSYNAGSSGAASAINTSSLIVPSITIVASKNIAGPSLDSTAWTSSLISISTANTVSTSNIYNQLSTTPAGIYTSSNAGNQSIGTNKMPATLTLVSTSGNANLDSAVTVSSAVNATATLGSINVINAVTSNSINLTAGTSILESGSGVVTTSLYGNNNGKLTVNSPLTSMGGSQGNQINNLLALNGSTSTTINSGIVNTLNISNGTNVSGDLTVTTSNQNISIGSAASDSVYIGGATNLDTSASNSSLSTLGAINTVSIAPNLYGNISVTTNNQPIQLGTLNSLANFGKIASSAGSGNITINEGGATNLGTTSTTGTLTVNAPLVVNTSGVVTATTANIYTGTSSAPGTISIGSNANNARITNLNVLNASAVTFNSGLTTGTSTIIADNNNLATLVLNASGGGALKYTQTGGSVTSVIDTVAGGLLTYNTINVPTASGSFTSSATGGGMMINAAGNSGLGSVTFNLADSNVTSTIQNNTSWTVSNLIESSAGSAAVKVSANAGPGANNTLTLGSGINLQNASGLVTFQSDNVNAGATNDGSYGSVIDSSTAITVNALSTSNTKFQGATITIANVSNVLPTVAFTSNGSISYTNNNNIVLGTLTLGTSAVGTSTVQSITGNISSVNNITDLSGKAPIQFLASTTGNNGVNLTGTNNFWGKTGSAVSVTASGNSYIKATGNTLDGINLGVINIAAGANAAASQLTVEISSGNISQDSKGSMYVWGNTTFKTTSGAVKVTNLGNNFGALTITSTSGDVSLTEAATSAYNQVTTTGNLTAISSTGDIITPNNSSGFNIGGFSKFTATGGVSGTGSISLTNVGNILNGSSGYVYLNSGSNSTIYSNQSALIIGTGSKIAGNLAITNAASSGYIQDQASTSGITVTGSSSFNETGLSGASIANGSVYLTGSNNVFTGGISAQASISNVVALKDIILNAGSRVGTAYYTAGTGNILVGSSGSSSYNYLTLSAPFGNITAPSLTQVTNQLYLSAPLGTADLSNLGLVTDLNNVQPTKTNVGTYVGPKP